MIINIIIIAKAILVLPGGCPEKVQKILHEEKKTRGDVQAAQNNGGCSLFNALVFFFFFFFFRW